MKTRIIQTMVGIILLAIGLNFMILGDVGISGFDTLTQFIADEMGIQFGNATLVMHAFYVVLLLVLLLMKKMKAYELLVSIISITFVSQAINLFSFITDITIDSYPVQWLSFLGGLILLSTGLAYFMKSNLIVTPADKFIVVFSQTFNFNVGMTKLVHDLVLLALIFIISVSIGGVSITPATIIATFGCGYIIKLVYAKL